VAAKPQSGGGEGLSIQTLLIAAVASGGAAVIVSYFWEPGTVMAAAITPVIVSLLREAVLPKAIDRPARVISEVRTGRSATEVPAAAGAGFARGRAGGTGATTAEKPPATERLPAEEPGLEDLEEETARLEEATPLDRETELLDPATRRLDEQTRPLEGETEPLAGPPPPVGQGLPPSSERTEPPHGPAGLDRNGGPSSPVPVRSPSSAPRRVYGVSRRARVRLAVITGLLGFLIAAVVLTVPELVTGGSVGGGDGRTTLFSAGGGEESEQGDGAEDRVTDDDGESPDGDGGEDGGGSEPVPDGRDSSSEPGEPSSERIQQNERSTERRAQPAKPQSGESGASQRSSSQRAPAQRAAPSSPSGGGGAAP
jgi:hypothetical protein